MDWATVASPALIGSFFKSAVEAAKRTLLTRFSNPVDAPTIITADSTEEALAFLSQVFSERGGPELASHRDKILVFDKPNVLPRLAEGVQTFIPVACTREVERELGSHAKKMHSIVVYPRNATRGEPHVILEPLSYETFNEALEEMGKDRDEISRLSNESGRSLTVLRRRLAIVDAVRVPIWADDKAVAERLVPFLFVGAWQSTNDADRAALCLIAGEKPYEELERELQTLVQLNDAPVWSIDRYRGVISKMDLLYAAGHAVTADDLKRYFQIAEIVLGEDDPALDLPEDRRWAAPIHGKTREFSSAFREGISETLVLLAIYGGHLFKKRVGVDAEAAAVQLVRTLLPSPLTTRILEANDRDLSTYAEAAPEEFLSIIERDLQSDDPAILGLLRPASTGIFGRSPSRTGLLYALEGLSWNPQTLPRAAAILARLAQVEIDDRWINKPINSLESIFRVWMPQTSANHETRVALIKALAKKFPEVVWKVCVAQFSEHHTVGHYSHKPRWRPDGYGFGEPLEWEPIRQFMLEMIEMAINWEDHSLKTLGDLVARMNTILPAHQQRVWALIQAWAQSKATDADKASLREKIRVSMLSRRAARRSKKDASSKTLLIAARAAYDALEPSDILNKYTWLFRDAWVEESADEIADTHFGYQKYEEKILDQRATALAAVLAVRGISGLFDLAKRGNGAWVIGRIIVGKKIVAEAQLADLLKLALQPILQNEEQTRASRNLIAGALRMISEDPVRTRVITQTVEALEEVQIVELLMLSPYAPATWRLVDNLSTAAQTKYWREVVPDWQYDSSDDDNEGVERLLKAGRPRAAFSCIRLHPERLDARVLYRLLLEMASGGNDKKGEYELEHYNVEEAFKHVNASPFITLDQKATLEFAFIEVLARPFERRNGTYGIPNLERYIEAHPELFVQAISWTYKRRDGGSDPEDIRVPRDRIKDMAQRGYTLLEAIHRVPGHDEMGQLKADNLAKWIATVRQSARELSRADVADNCIGELLSHAAVGSDGVWPSEPVRQVIEEVQSEALVRGVQRGIYNSRGAQWRGEGGDQEREIAARYRAWTQALQSSYPYVSNALLMGIVRMYEADANREDTEADIKRRLR